FAAIAPAYCLDLVARSLTIFSSSFFCRLKLLVSISPLCLPPGLTEWTSWFNIDHPGGNGDYERLEAIRFYYRERVCARPTAMEARTTDWVAAADTGEIVHSSLEKGFWCINKEQPHGRICSNYHVRFQCPPVQSYWTDWSEWGPCSTTVCNDVGVQVRQRKCVSAQPMPLLFVPACIGHHAERRECSTPPCTGQSTEMTRLQYFVKCSLTVYLQIKKKKHLLMLCIILFTAKESPACNSSPEMHLVRLPMDCVQPGTHSKYYNAGRCPHNKCPGSLDFDMRCRDGAGFCCGVQEMESRIIDCGTYKLPIRAVIQCSCQKCVQPTLLVRGRVVAADNDEPLRFGHIYIGKDRVGTTGYQGGFTLQITPDTQRLVVNFVDPTQTFIDTPKVFIFDKKGGSIYHNVKVMRKQTPVDINSSETNFIDLGEIKGEDPIGQLVIPPNSFHKDNGEVYEGTVKASVTFIDPRNITTAAATPGDLNFVDEEGDMLPLRTYGMFSVDFRDETSKEVLGAGAVQVLLDTQHVKMQEHIPKMKLWSLNPDTGVWEEESDFSYSTTTAGGHGRSKREERTFLIGNMEIRERRLFNLDVPENRRCYVKVRAYMSDKFLPTEQLEGVVISLINLEPKPGYSSNPRAWGRFDSVLTGPNGACLPAFCDAMRPDAYTAYVTAMLGGEELEAAPSSPKMNPNIIGVSQPYLDKLDYQRSDHEDPALKKTAFRINLAKPNQNNLDETNGPIYPYQNLLSCENAPFDANHFRFFRVEKDKYEYNVVPFEENDLTTWTGDYLSWWPNPQEFRACFIKVKIHGQKEVMVRSRNLGGTHPETRGKLYGIRDIRSTRDMREANTSAACLEFKCSGMLFDQAEVDRSLISVIPQGNCRKIGINGLLQEYLIKHPPVAQNNESHAFTMLAPVDPLGHNYGIYTVTDQNPRVAKEIAIGRCFDGTSDGFSREMKSDFGVALTFSCPERKINRESLFQRLQTNPGQTLSQMARDMREMEGLQGQRSSTQVVAFPAEQRGRTQSRRASSANRRRASMRAQQRQ
uniref:Cartilage intermediate layer protein 2 n=1 Tax=Fundulus heteroclitus TaxID=8078 RepID=A0A3Q2PZR3_FUNHE